MLTTILKEYRRGDVLRDGAGVAESTTTKLGSVRWLWDEPELVAINPFRYTSKLMAINHPSADNHHSIAHYPTARSSS